MQTFFNFFTVNYGQNSIIIVSTLILLLIIYRTINLKRLGRDKVEVKQAAEYRDNHILTRDQYELKLWKQIVTESKVIVIGVHGLQGQKDDFKLLSNYCKQQKWSLITFDRRGAGKNLMGWKFHSFKTDINDLKDVVLAIKDKHPNHKIFLFGEAIGASIASYACKDNHQVNGLIIANLITKYNLYPISLGFYFRFLIGFLFNSDIKLPISIDPQEVSNNHAYITNMKQRYSQKQVWSLKYLLQLKKLNKTTPKIIRRIKQPSLILQSGDDVFSDFHQLKLLDKKWKPHQKYHFIFNGKHALINEPEMKKLFEQEIAPWIKTIVERRE